MAESIKRKVDIEVTAKDSASAVMGKVGKSAQQMGRDVSRSGFETRPSAAAMARSRGGASGKNQVAEFLGVGESTGKLGMAVATSEMIGRGMQKLPDAAERIRQSFEMGASALDVFAMEVRNVPGLGSMVKGFDAVGQVIEDLKNPMAAAKRRRAEEEKARDASIRETLGKRAAERAPFLSGLSDRARLAGQEMELGEYGPGIQGERRQAEIELANARREIAKGRERARNMVGPDGERAQRDLDTLEAAAVARRDKRLAELSRDFIQKREDAEHEHEERLSAIQLAAQQDRLQQHGRYLESRLAGIKGEADREVAALQAAYDREKRDNPDFVETDARRRLNRETGSVRARQAREERDAREADRLEREREGREFETTLRSRQGDLAERRMRLSGANEEADQYRAAREYREELEQVQNDLQEKLRTQSERAPELRQQAAQMADMAKREYETSLAELSSQREAQFRSEGPRALGESRLLRGVTGLFGAGKDQADDRAAREREIAKKQRDEQLKAIKDLATALREGQVKLTIATN